MTLIGYSDLCSLGSYQWPSGYLAGAILNKPQACIRATRPGDWSLNVASQLHPSSTLFPGPACLLPAHPSTQKCPYTSWTWLAQEPCTSSFCCCCNLNASYLCQHCSSSTGVHVLHSTCPTGQGQHKQLALVQKGGVDGWTAFPKCASRSPCALQEPFTNTPLDCHQPLAVLIYTCIGAPCMCLKTPFRSVKCCRDHKA